MKLDDYKTNPADHFKTPASVLEQPSLSSEDKEEILLSWKDQLMQLQTATDENMPQLDKQHIEKVSLQQVELALEELESAGGKN
jgi:hypothetical protein